jgi:hypothetical protein
MDEGFHVGLTPIELIASTDYDGSFDSKDSDQFNLNLHDFTMKVYHKKPNESSMDCSSSGLSCSLLYNWPKSVQLTYIMSEMESSLLFYQNKYSEHYGNEPSPGENHYLCGALVVFQKK